MYRLNERTTGSKFADMQRYLRNGLDTSTLQGIEATREMMHDHAAERGGRGLANIFTPGIHEQEILDRAERLTMANETAARTRERKLMYSTGQAPDDGKRKSARTAKYTGQLIAGEVANPRPEPQGAKNRTKFAAEIKAQFRQLAKFVTRHMPTPPRRRTEEARGGFPPVPAAVPLLWDTLTWLRHRQNYELNRVNSRSRPRRPQQRRALFFKPKP